MTQPLDSGRRDEIERLQEENALLWRAYELLLGNPYQGRPGGMEQWESELDSAQEALRDRHRRRVEAGVSLWSTCHTCRRHAPAPPPA